MDVTVRPLAESDIDAAREVQSRAFQALDRAFGEPGWEVTPAVVERQRRRITHFLRHDPDGSWVAAVDGVVAGAALALRRKGLWGLSLLVVDPEHQSRGIGRQLLDASLSYAAGADTAVILSSRDARAMHRYAAAGFDLYPQVSAAGPVDRSRLQRPDRPVRPGTEADVELADAVDVTVRGAPRGPDHQALAAQATMWVADSGADRGYAYVRPEGRVVTVAATDDSTAAALLWQCLGEDVDGPERSLDHITGEQQWAVRIAVAAGMRLAAGGPVFWRGRQPPRSYIPDGAYL